MEMKIPEGALQAVVAAAVVNALGDEARNKILQEKEPELRAHVDAIFEEAYREAVKVHKEALIANFAEAFKTCFVRRF